jgi:hypothetical protein
MMQYSDVHNGQLSLHVHSPNSYEGLASLRASINVRFASSLKTAVSRW